VVGVCEFSGIGLASEPIGAFGLRVVAAAGTPALVAGAAEAGGFTGPAAGGAE
jgi:hypothetical protein